MGYIITKTPNKITKMSYRLLGIKSLKNNLVMTINSIPITITFPNHFFRMILLMDLNIE
jgi:hypothetical protein